MGKYQLDYKGMQQVERFHEKHSTKKVSKKLAGKDLRARFLEKAREAAKK
ncbi:hypothetical protein ACVRZD_09685 [Streptococcus hongkongensis]